MLVMKKSQRKKKREGTAKKDAVRRPSQLFVFVDEEDEDHDER